jgi:hypothetical protein
MKFYVYALVEADSVRLEGAPAGIGGAQPLLRPYGDFHAIVSGHSGTAPVADRASLLAHSRVLDFVLGQSTPLPFRFGIIVTEDTLADFIRDNEARLTEQLEAVRGCVEMTVKILLKRTETTPEGEPAEGTGTRFLRAKHEVYLCSKNAAEWLNDGMKGLIRAACFEMLPTRKPIVRIAHLVDRAQVGAYGARLKQLTTDRSEFGFLQSGPWPPYSFVSADPHKLEPT